MNLVVMGPTRGLSNPVFLAGQWELRKYMNNRLLNEKDTEAVYKAV